MGDLRAAALASGHVKHGAIRSWAMDQYGLGYGDANAVASAVLHLLKESRLERWG
jgi:hypothetical protein